MSRRRIILIALGVIVLLLLPLPLAERYTSPNQDGQYIRNPVLAYQFVLAAARVSTSAELNTSGEALRHAKDLYDRTDTMPVKVELLFLPTEEPYSYTTREGDVLTIENPGDFVWEVWAFSKEQTESKDAGELDLEESDVVGHLDYVTGDLLGAGPQPQDDSERE